MSHLVLRVLGMIGLLLALAAPPANAQEPPVRVRGTIDRVEGDVYVVKARGGGELKVKLAEKATVVALTKASLADIKQGSYVGVAGMPQADGSQKALEVHIFPEAMRGTGDGHRGWDLQPSSTMTNGNVEQTAASSDGQVLTLKYKDGEKKIVVPARRADRRLRAGRQERAEGRGQHLHLRRGEAARRHPAGAARQRRPRRRAADVSIAGAQAQASASARASLRMRSTMEKKPFERCGVRCSSSPSSANSARASARRISSAVLSWNMANRMAISPRTMWASLSPSNVSTGAAPGRGGRAELASQTWLAQPRTLLASVRSASGNGASPRPSSMT